MTYNGSFPDGTSSLVGSPWRSLGTLVTQQTNNTVSTISNGRDAVKRAFDAGAIILREGTDSVDDVVEVFAGNRRLAQIDRPAGETAFRLAAEIHDDFDEVFQVGLAMQRITNVGRHHAQE